MFEPVLTLAAAQGRSLEEVDETFDKGIRDWQFRHDTTDGSGAKLNAIRQANVQDLK